MLIRLPWPPSINNFYRATGGRVLISSQGRAYIQLVGITVRTDHPRRDPLSGRLRVSIEATVPDNRKRDLDNLLKPLLDCLTKCGVWGDDCQIDELSIRRGPVTAPGWLDVEIETL